MIGKANHKRIIDLQNGILKFIPLMNQFIIAAGQRGEIKIIDPSE
jgi:hypothetical protein